MMTDERIQEIRSMLEGLKQNLPYPWHLWRGRSNQEQVIPAQNYKRSDGSIQSVPAKKTVIPARYDLFSGPEIEDKEELRKIVNKGCKQVCHWHQESPTIYDLSTGYEWSMPFIEKSPEIVEELLNEIERLRG